MTVAKTIGNRVAPPRFLLFIGLLVVGWAIGVTMLGWQSGVMVGFDVAALGFLVASISLFDDTPRSIAARMPGQRCQPRGPAWHHLRH